jgi:hypothetical protein
MPLPSGAIQTMAFQIVELKIEKNNEVVVSALPQRHKTRGEAEEEVRRLVASYQTSGFNSEDRYWWAFTVNGEEMRFSIDWCA